MFINRLPRERSEVRSRQRQSCSSSVDQAGCCCAAPPEKRCRRPSQETVDTARSRRTDFSTRRLVETSLRFCKMRQLASPWSVQKIGCRAPKVVAPPLEQWAITDSSGTGAALRVGAGPRDLAKNAPERPFRAAAGRLIAAVLALRAVLGRSGELLMRRVAQPPGPPAITGGEPCS